MIKSIEQALLQVLQNSEFPEFALSVALLMVLNSALMFPPSEFVCIGIGMYVSARGENLKEQLAAACLLVILATLSNLAGTSIWYFKGRKDLRNREKLWERATNFRQPWKNLAEIFFSKAPAILKLFERKGPAGLLVLRNVPLVRSIASYPAGWAGMKLLPFIVSSCAGIAIWVTLWTSLGITLGSVAFEYTTLVAILVGISSAVLYRFSDRVFVSSQEKAG